MEGKNITQGRTSVNLALCPLNMLLFGLRFVVDSGSLGQLYRV